MKTGCKRHVLAGALFLLGSVCAAGEYGQYQVARLVHIERGQGHIDTDYLDPWLADLEVHTLDSLQRFDSHADRERAIHDVQALETLVGLAVLEQGTAELLIRRALLASIAYQLQLDGAANRATQSFNRLLYQTPDNAAVEFRYGQFLFNSGQFALAAEHLDSGLQHGSLEAELWLGMALYLDGQVREGEKHLQHYQQMHPEDLRVAHFFLWEGRRQQ
jgi:predicted Zn-dependent protease